MKRIALLMMIPYLLTGFPSCVEPTPFTVGVCKDGTCINVGGVIPARKSGKETREVEP